jgi:hypothetical protein
MSGWHLPAAGEIRNPFVKTSANQPTQPISDISSIWNIKKPEVFSIEFHFGTGQMFTSTIDPKKNEICGAFEIECPMELFIAVFQIIELNDRNPSLLFNTTDISYESLPSFISEFPQTVEIMKSDE